MAKRKSSRIGTISCGLEVLDSFRDSKTQSTKFVCRCTKCGKEQIKGFASIVDEKTTCNFCNPRRIQRNICKNSGTRIYTHYWEMMRRVKRDHYKNRGIEVCDEWKSDFMKFKEWSESHGYQDGLTLDRIDNDKGYSPENCRWTTFKVQANNRSSNVIVEYEGEKYTGSQLAEYIGLSKNCVKQRIKNGWSAEDIVKTPYKSRKKWSEYATAGKITD